jgi:UDP-N-acetylglucosamine 4,6-dehydratase/5-epimerase
MSKHLVIGGTGTLGTEITRRLLARGESVVCYSRDELKQKQLKAAMKSDRLWCVLGDVRDRETLFQHVPGVHTIFHVAALKHVDIAEDNPEEAVRTNILGSMNVADAAAAFQVPYCVLSSTDKAVDPVNVYGNTKAIAERVFLRRNEMGKRTRFSAYRWGNVLNSRGSVISAFAESLLNYQKVFLTSPEMSRFWIPIQDAVDFMLNTYQTSPTDRVSIPSIKSAALVEVVEAIAELLGIKGYGVEITGLRKGEKLHEVLLSQHANELSSADPSHRMTYEELKDILLPELVDYMPQYVVNTGVQCQS